MKTKHTKATHKNIMVLTPTHNVKDYAARHLVAHTSTAFPVEKRGGPYWWCVAANSREFNWSPYIDATDAGIRCIHFSHLSDEYYGCEGAIHRRVVYTMNQLRECFLASNKRWFLSLEADVLVTASDINALITRVNEGRLVCLHANCYAGFNTSPVFCRTTRITLGCTLIHRSIIEKYEFRYEPEKLAAFHDAFLITDMVRDGVPAHYDPNIKPKHVSRDRGPDGKLRRGWDKLPISER